MTSVFEWVVFLTGPFLLIWRRAFYIGCWSYGQVLAAQMERTLTEKEAFELGKSRVMAAMATGVIDWVKTINFGAFWAASVLIFANWWTAAKLFWRGLRRDALLIWGWMRNLREPPPPRPEIAQAMAALSEHGAIDDDSDHDVAGTAWDLERQRMALEAKRNKDYGDHLDIRRVSKILFKYYQQSPALAALIRANPPPQQFAGIGAIATPWKMYAMIGVGVIAFAGWGIAWERGVRLDRVKLQAAELTRQADALGRAQIAFKAALTQRDARIVNSTKICLSEIETARQSALKAEQTAARERARRIHEQRKTLDGGGAVPVSDILRNIPGLAGDSPAPSAAADPGSPILPP